MSEGLQSLPGALVFQGDYYGSLAAVRCLGGAGVLVVFAEHRRLAPAIWSRYVAQRENAPAPTDLRVFGDWLVKFGASHPGLFLYPTSDDLCWIIETRRSELSRHFLLHPAKIGAMRALLDKRDLAAAAARVGLHTPETWFPRSADEVRELAPRIASWPVLLKPRTQMGFLTKGKGILCAKSEDLAAAVSHYRAAERYHPDVVAHDPSVTWPMVQRYHASAMDGILSVAGYVGVSPETTVMRAARKVFQRPRRLGVGVGFEARPVPEDLAAQVAALCQDVGYSGVFEAEFLEGDGRLLLVDFNPRYYGQMSFEVMRGLPSPLLACLAAAGRDGELRRVAVEAKAQSGAPLALQSTFALTWILRLLLVTQSLGGLMSRGEASSWRRWLKDPSKTHFDALFNSHDAVPAWLDVLTQVAFFLRHPRDFFRKFFRSI